MKFVIGLLTIFTTGFLLIYLTFLSPHNSASDIGTVTDPRGDYSRITGMQLPRTTVNIVASDSHGGFHGDGTFQLSAILQSEDVELTLAASAPWNSRWRRYSELSGEEKRRVSRNETAFFATRERCCESIPWHNGDVLSLDPTNGRLELISWDY